LWSRTCKLVRIDRSHMFRPEIHFTLPSQNSGSPFILYPNLLQIW
jgi:hypothetical protein